MTLRTATTAMTTDTPIYDRLMFEFQMAGKYLPMKITFTKPRGTIRFLSPKSDGMHFTLPDMRWRIQQRYATMVCNGKDNCPVCGLFNPDL